MMHQIYAPTVSPPLFSQQQYHGPFSDQLPFAHWQVSQNPPRPKHRRARPGSRTRRAAAAAAAAASRGSAGSIQGLSPSLTGGSIEEYPHWRPHVKFPTGPSRSSPSPLFRLALAQSQAQVLARERAAGGRNHESIGAASRGSQLVQLKAEQRRLFGEDDQDGTDGTYDEEETWEMERKMLEVVMALWGDVDYVDP